MYTRRCLLYAFLGASLLSAQESPQQATQSVHISGTLKQPLKITAGDLAKMPLWVQEVLKKAGVPQGRELRGKALASSVLAEAQDGYQVVLSLAELDPSFIDNEILLADTANGKALFGAQGRFPLVVPKDKPGARSVCMLTRIEVGQIRK